MDTLCDYASYDRALHPAAAISLQVPAFKERAPWLGGDLQSVRNFLRQPAVDLKTYASKRIVLPLDSRSGDRASAVLHQPKSEEAGRRPVVVLIHGLTGCEDSVYIRSSAAHLLRAGFRVLRLNLRGAGPTRAHCGLHYHAGRSEDLRLMLTALPPAVLAGAWSR
jgi:uncharacterized protein